MERVMWTKVGVVRNGKDMQEALPEIQEIRERIKSSSGCSSPSPSRGGVRGGVSAIYNAPWNESINTENLSLIAEMLTRSALAREESRGAHYRSDFPNQNIEWLKNICMTPLLSGDFKTEYREVQFTRITPQELLEQRKRAGLVTLPVINDE
jgi:succinate dehydrogenase/fumarate reductase flavoprotein subunit